MQQQLYANSCQTGRIHQNRLSVVNIPVTKDTLLSYNSVCPLTQTIDTKMLQQLLPASLGGGGGSDPLGHLLPSTECDWEQELLSVANCPTKLDMISTALDHGPSTLNTPTIEINQDFMFSNSSRKETIMAELSVDVAPPTSGIFDDLWTIPGTPDAQELLHAPLMIVEGKSEPNIEFTEHSTFSNGDDYVIKSDDDDSMIVEAKEEVPDVLQWIVDDTINQNSEIPGEEFNTPVTVVLEPPFTEYLPSTSVGTDPLSPVVNPTPFSRCLFFICQTDTHGLVMFYLFFTVLCFMFAIFSKFIN